MMVDCSRGGRDGDGVNDATLSPSAFVLNDEHNNATVPSLWSMAGLMVVVLKSGMGQHICTTYRLYFTPHEKKNR
jgi:hypothetical protein